MRANSRPRALSFARSSSFRCVAAVTVANFFAIHIALTPTANADRQLCTVVARVDAKSEALAPRDIVIKVENVSTAVTAIKASPEIPRNIAIVMDAGPDQATVLSKEKALAVTLINKLYDANTSFTVASAGTSSTLQPATLDRSVAIGHIREIRGDIGEKTNVPICDTIASAIRQISHRPGLRVLLFIGEGNDGGSSVSYAELRRLAESNHISVFAALLADHSLRGARSILRYGWNLQDLASDTAGLSLENQNAAKAAGQISNGIRSLRLITFEMSSPPPGHCKISISLPRGKTLRTQKAITIP
jgi:hypothetical protein